jgi:RNA polymerase sigma factor (sigma-70 family)
MGELFRDDAALWRGVIQGNQDAFRVLYETYADMLYAYGLRYMSDTATVKDCIHDLFIDLHTYHNTLAAEVNIRFYLLRSLRRKLHVAFRKASFTTQAGIYGADLEKNFQLTFTDDIEKTLILNEQQQQTVQLLLRKLNDLPARQKELIYLKFHHELEYEEIAVLMGISVATCRTLAYRAIKQLREDMTGMPIPLVTLFLLGPHLF